MVYMVYTTAACLGGDDIAGLGGLLGHLPRESALRHDHSAALLINIQDLNGDLLAGYICLLGAGTHLGAREKNTQTEGIADRSTLTINHITS